MSFERSVTSKNVAGIECVRKSADAVASQFASIRLRSGSRRTASISWSIGSFGVAVPQIAVRHEDVGRGIRGEHPDSRFERAVEQVVVVVEEPEEWRGHRLARAAPRKEDAGDLLVEHGHAALAPQPREEVAVETPAVDHED